MREASCKKLKHEGGDVFMDEYGVFGMGLVVMEGVWKCFGVDRAVE